RRWGDLLVGSQDPPEVQRIRGRHGDRLLSALPALVAKHSDSIRERVLLAVEAGDEPAAAHLTAGLEHAERARDLPPGHRLLLPLHGLAEHDAGAGEELPSDEFGRRENAASFRRKNCRRRGVLAGEEAPAADGERLGTAAPRRKEEGAEAGIGVARHDARRDELLEIRLELVWRRPGRAEELQKEHR